MAVRWADAEPDSGRDAARVCSFPRGFASRLAQGHPPLPRLPALVMHRREKMSGKLTLGHRNKVAGNSSGSGLARPTPRTPILLLREVRATAHLREPLKDQAGGRFGPSCL